MVKKRIKRTKKAKRKSIKVKTYPIIKYTTLTGKSKNSRRGEYVSVILAKGQRTKLYKKQKGMTSRDYLNVALHGVVSKKKGAKSVKEAEKYFKKVSKSSKIMDLIEKGYAETNIDNVLDISPYGIKTSYMNLLTNKEKRFKGAIVKDKQLAEILTRPTNVEEWKNRIEYKISFIGLNDKLLATVLASHRNKDLNQVIRDLKEAGTKKGIEIADFSPNIKQSIEKKGYKYEHRSNGRLKTINIKMVFRNK